MDRRGLFRALGGTLLGVVGVRLAHADPVKAVSLAAPAVMPDSAANLIGYAWPVGSIYQSLDSQNPATLFGMGTWVEYGAGRVSVTHSHTHTSYSDISNAHTHALNDAQSYLVAHRWRRIA